MIKLKQNTLQANTDKTNFIEWLNEKYENSQQNMKNTNNARGTAANMFRQANKQNIINTIKKSKQNHSNKSVPAKKEQLWVI